MDFIILFSIIYKFYDNIFINFYFYLSYFNNNFLILINKLHPKHWSHPFLFTPADQFKSSLSSYLQQPFTKLTLFQFIHIFSNNFLREMICLQHFYNISTTNPKWQVVTSYYCWDKKVILLLVSNSNQ